MMKFALTLGAMVTNFTPFPVLETERLVLRQPASTDDEDNYAMRSNDSVNRYLEGYRHHSIEETREWLQKIMSGIAAGELVFWIITLKSTGTFIGSICFWNFDTAMNKAEFGYTLMPACQGQGYMQEAFKTVLDYGLNTMRLQTIEACTHLGNIPSQRLLYNHHFTVDNTRIPAKKDGVLFVFCNR